MKNLALLTTILATSALFSVSAQAAIKNTKAVKTGVLNADCTLQVTTYLDVNLELPQGEYNTMTKLVTSQGYGDEQIIYSGLNTSGLQDEVLNLAKSYCTPRESTYDEYLCKDGVRILPASLPYFFGPENYGQRITKVDIIKPQTVSCNGLNINF